MSKSKTIAAVFAAICICAAALFFASCGNTGTEYTLEDLGEAHAEARIEQAKESAGGEGEYSVVILDKDATLKNLANYSFSENLDTSKIVRGLFVKVERPSAPALYFNFGLELSVEQESAVSVSTGTPEDAWYDEWTLEVVKENSKLLFEEMH